MFKYVSDISNLAHYIIERFVDNKDIAIDATLGNGYDTDFLSEKFNKVYSFEIQKEACDTYVENKKDNVAIINDSHHKFKEYIKENVDCIIYNLGFLPGGNKEITTTVDTTLLSIKDGVEILNSGGIIAIAIYIGHDQGKIEENAIMSYVGGLEKDKYGVIQHKYVNRSKYAPILIVIEKK